MKYLKNKSSHITVTVNSSDRDVINRIAQELDIPQRRVVSLLVQNYQGAHDPPDRTTNTIKQSSERILKRIDSLIAIIRDQEKNIFKPTLISCQNSYSIQKAGINEILTTLSQLIQIYNGQQ